MVIYVDTRQKAGKHTKKHKKLEEMGYALEHRKLDIGDYMLEGNEKISVDTKKDLQEVYSNIINDKSRFMKEIRRAYTAGVKLYVLIEHGGSIHTMYDVAEWKPRYGNISGRNLMDRMLQIHRAYGTEFLFCDKRKTAKRIVEILKGAYNEQSDILQKRNKKSVKL